MTTLGISEGRDVATAAAWAAARWPGQALILYGFSMGSAAILHAVAHAGVQPAAVILEAPFDRLLNAVRNRFERMGVPASPAAEVLVFWGSVQGGTNGFAHNPADDAAAVHCPALVLRGAVDRNVSDAAAHTVYNALAGRKAYVEVPGADHQLLIGANPTLWKAEVQSFLATVGNAP